MRLGPPPRMMIFFLSDGVASQAAPAGERRLIGRIHVGRRRRELRGAGVDALEHGLDVERARAGRDLGFAVWPVSLASRASEKPIALSRRNVAALAGKPLALDLAFHVDDAADLAPGTTDRSC